MALLTKHEKEERSHKLVSLTNAFGFSMIILMDWHELAIKLVGFGTGVIGNIICLLLGNKIGNRSASYIYALYAILCATKGYSLYTHGSHAAYICFFVIVVMYIFLAIFYPYLSKRKLNKDMNKAVSTKSE